MKIYQLLIDLVVNIKKYVLCFFICRISISTTLETPIYITSTIKQQNHEYQTI